MIPIFGHLQEGLNGRVTFSCKRLALCIRHSKLNWVPNTSAEGVFGFLDLHMPIVTCSLNTGTQTVTNGCASIPTADPLPAVLLTGKASASPDGTDIVLMLLLGCANLQALTD